MYRPGHSKEKIKLLAKLECFIEGKPPIFEETCIFMGISFLIKVGMFPEV